MYLVLESILFVLTEGCSWILRFADKTFLFFSLLGSFVNVFLTARLTASPDSHG
jgi:hypothetical protein